MMGKLHTWRTRLSKVFHVLNTQVAGINERNAAWVYRLNKRSAFPFADDKVLTKSRIEPLGISCPETYKVIENLGELETAWNELSHLKINSFAIKPARGKGGGGILVVTRKLNGWEVGGKPWTEDKILFHMANIIMGAYSGGSKDKVLIEYKIRPSSFFSRIYPSGVPDFRVILVNDEPILSMLRVPTDKSNGKANLHQGGLGIGIDMEEGCLNFGFDGGRYHAVHPDNGNQIEGLLIPRWKDVLELSIETSKAFPNLNYLGIDIVLDENLGPMVLEINVRPGLGIQLVNKKGIKECIRQTRKRTGKLKGVAAQLDNGLSPKTVVVW